MYSSYTSVGVSVNRIKPRNRPNRTLYGHASELEKFSSEDVEDESLGLKFDILNWWKINSPRFPILSLLARDVLAIPISIVASESVFSTSGRVLDVFRSSLNTDMVECLTFVEAEVIQRIHKIELKHGCI
ncbi:hypothetical protein L2E82_21455 [Cichorium intybus]|uniref:Uncharacterized protein n=1 Tax=Cichorium intybus TaxID=13427 RepID=A0ACB9DWT5_CICIN|nr:hypothetical protein L2E82_21455 [Cichorium intybus]